MIEMTFLQFLAIGGALVCIGFFGGAIISDTMSKEYYRKIIKGLYLAHESELRSVATYNFNLGVKSVLSKENKE